MTQKNSSPKSSNKQQYSVGSLIVTILLVGAYWWLTGSLPGNDTTASDTPVTHTPIGVSTPVAVIVESSNSVTATVEAVVPEMAASTEEAPTAEPLTEVATESAVAQGTATPPPTAISTAVPTATATKPAKPSATPTNPPRAGPSGMAVMTLDELPLEAVETIDLIFTAGPFPFDRDGITFQNREGLLPHQARGYYSEYTVITPGSRDRGARRIVAGEAGEFYYTDDHYESFVWVEVP